MFQQPEFLKTSLLSLAASTCLALCPVLPDVVGQLSSKSTVNTQQAVSWFELFLHWHLDNLFLQVPAPLCACVWFAPGCLSSGLLMYPECHPQTSCSSLWVISIQRGPTDFSSDLVRFPAGLTQVSTHPLLCLLLTWLISEPLFCTRFYSSFLSLLTVGVWVLLTLLPSFYHSLSFLLLLPKGLPMSISSSLWPTSPDWAF